MILPCRIVILVLLLFQEVTTGIMFVPMLKRASSLNIGRNMHPSQSLLSMQRKAGSSWRSYRILSQNTTEKDSASDDLLIISVTRNWVRGWVSRLGLCPWATGSLVGQRMSVVVVNESDSSMLERANLLNKICKEVKLLAPYSNDLVNSSRHDSNSAESSISDDRRSTSSPETILVVLPRLQRFSSFLHIVAMVENRLEKLDLDQYIQTATFHPQYQFEGTSPSALENYTNKAPYPIIQFLLVEQMTQAIKDYDGSTEDIWKKNIELMNTLGKQKIHDILKDIYPQGHEIT